MQKPLVTIVVLWWTFAFVARAEAYLDPGSGSMLLQVLLGGVASVAVLLRFYWNRVTSLLPRRHDPDERP